MLWAVLVGSTCLTMLCAVNFKSWRWNGTNGWSDGGTAWVMWGSLGSGLVLCLLLLAALADVGWLERLDPSWVARVALLAAVGVSVLTSYYSWNHRRHLVETLLDGWTLDVAWGLAWAPWVAGIAAATAMSLMGIDLAGRTWWSGRPVSSVVVESV